MSYLVVKVCQFPEHDNEQEAIKDAIKGAEATGRDHYVVEVRHKTTTRTTVSHHACILTQLPARNGDKWYYKEDMDLINSWMSGKSISTIAKEHKRTEEAIRCRLERADFDGRTHNTYRGR